MFVITDGTDEYKVTITRDFPEGKEWYVADFEMSKKQFKRRAYNTRCYLIEEGIELTPKEFFSHYGQVIVGFEDRFIINKIDGARKAFTRAIKDFPRSTRKLFWQQYWEMEKQWV